MPRFHTLKVTNVRKTIRDAVVVSLQPTDGDFKFIPGQYLTFRQTFDGTELRRSYSICSHRDEGLQVAIKRVDGGAFSTWANTELGAGMTLEAMEPMGTFQAPILQKSEQTYLGFAGGSGITPVLSILKTVLTEEPNSRFTLIYANRGVNTIMFREEIDDLKNLYMERLTVIHILESDAQDIDLFTGRVDEDKCAALFKNWVDIKSVTTAFICGPEPMMLGISAALQDHGLSKEQIKFELFSSGQPGRLPQRISTQSADPSRKIKVQVTLDGAMREIEMSPDQCVLDAALENTLDAPFACKAGVCSTCKCRVIEGEVEMIANHALEDYEVEAGFILSCQSYPISETLIIDYDQH